MAKKKLSKRAKASLATLSDYKTVFKSEEGRRVLWDLMKQASMISTSYVQGDPHSTSFNEGTRSVCLHILKKISTDVEKLEQRISEGEQHDESLFENY